MTEDNFELLGLLRDNIDLENLRVKEIDKERRSLRQTEINIVKGIGYSDQEYFDQFQRQIQKSFCGNKES
jgi:hypothetical protein